MTFTNVTLYFHNYSESDLSNNQSIYIFSGANSLQSNEVLATQTVLKTNIRFVYSGTTAWIAYISWFTESLQTECHLKGSADIEVWMNSVDSLGLFGGSGYGSGLIEIDENNNLAWNTSMSYKFGLGKIISNKLSLYKFTIDNIDHVFSKGHRVGFIIGVGSTNQAWEVNIYFGSLSMNSRAIIPVDCLIIGDKSSISSIVDPLIVPLGANITVRGQIQPSQANQKVILRFVKPQGNAEIKTTFTSNNSTYLYNYKPDQFGKWNVSASWNGNVNFSESTSQIESFAVTTSTKKGLAILVVGSGTTDPFPSIYIFNKSEVVNIKSLPNTGWILDRWLIDGTPSSSKDSISLSMDSDHTLIAIFIEKTILEPWTNLLLIIFLTVTISVLIYIMKKRGILFKHIFKRNHFNIVNFRKYLVSRAYR